VLEPIVSWVSSTIKHARYHYSAWQPSEQPLTIALSPTGYRGCSFTSKTVARRNGIDRFVIAGEAVGQGKNEGRGARERSRVLL
jgi:hypothetical protein